MIVAEKGRGPLIKQPGPTGPQTKGYDMSTDTMEVNPGTEEITEQTTEQEQENKSGRGKPKSPEFPLSIATDKNNDPIPLKTIEATEKRPSRQVLTAVPYNWTDEYKALTASEFDSDVPGLFDRYMGEVWCPAKAAYYEEKAKQHVRDADNATNPLYQAQRATENAFSRAEKTMEALCEGLPEDQANEMRKQFQAMQERLSNLSTDS